MNLCVRQFVFVSEKSMNDSVTVLNLNRLEVISLIKGELLETLFEAAHIQRWNDHLRPHNFVELDKQAHKMVLAYIIGKFEESEKNSTVNWGDLIEGGMFEFLQRVVLTDIKPPIYNRLMEESGRELKEWVWEKLKHRLSPTADNLGGRFRRYLLDDHYAPLEKSILHASHYLATKWEFQHIFQLNNQLYGIEETKRKIENELEDHYSLSGVQKLELKNKTYRFIDLVGQLRFQKRWAHSPRVPETSVLGHMLLVAVISYLCSLELNACKKRKYNNYFTALFHDLPEVLTRDIISPVKRSVKGLDNLIKKIENRQVEERILPLLPRDWHKEMKFFLDSEFVTLVKTEAGYQETDTETINQNYNEDKYSPLDGKMIKACDEMAAYIEASQSINHGITSKHLEEAREELLKKYTGVKFAGLPIGELFTYFHDK